jgi:ribosome-associated heat shock protein Hsp15
MEPRIRIDKWLWHARFYRTRALAQAAATGGLIRLNGHRVEKASVGVGPGDILTVPRGTSVVAVRVQALAVRRGAAKEAQGLYEVIGESLSPSEAFARPC